MKTFYARVLQLALAAWLACAAAPTFAADADAPERTKVGIIQEVNLGGSTLVVEGMRYGVAFDVRVEIDGSYGAFSMLERGMQIRFTYLVHSESERTIVEIQHIPDRFAIERV